MATPRPSRLKLALFWLVAFGLGMTILLAGMEVLLRITLSRRFQAETNAPLVRSTIPGLLYQLAPNRTGDVVTDSRGFLARPPDPAPVRHTVLLLGDSVTFGSGVPYANTYGPHLESLLTERLGAPTAVWNAAVPGYNTTQEAIALSWAGPLVKPDLIIVEVCMNDYLTAPDLTPGGTLDATTAEGRGGISLTGVLYRSRVVVFLKEKLKDIQRARPEWFPASSHYVHYIHAKAGWDNVKQALVSIQQQATAMHAQLLVVIFPVEPQLRLPDRTAQDDLLGFTKAQGIRTLDLYDDFRARWHEGLFIDYWAQAGQVDKLHLNERGHALVAQLIANAVLTERLRYFPH